MRAADVRCWIPAAGSKHMGALPAGIEAAPRRNYVSRRSKNSYAFLVAFASAFFFKAHRWRILSAAAFLWAALKVRPFFFGAAAADGETAMGVTPVETFLGGRPGRLPGP